MAYEVKKPEGNWAGTHGGVKKGKTFAEPAPPNKKSQARLEARIKAYEEAKVKAPSKIANGLRKPGSQKIKW